MHFRVRFRFESTRVNNEIDMSIWKFLPCATKIGVFSKSGYTWLETKEDYSVEEFSQVLQKAICDVFAYYKTEDMFGYVEAGYEQHKGAGIFTVSAFAPPVESVERIKMLTSEVKLTEECLYDLNKTCGELFGEIEKHST